MIDSMLVATDGSDTAAKAVAEAADLAEGTGARVHVMTAYQPLRAKVASGKAVDPEVGDWHLAEDSRADSILDEACATFRVRGVEAEPHARRGDPADAIIGLAEELGTDLIVVGNKGLAGARRFLLGSVPDKVSHHAPCSVLIVYTT
jgi:nucleotide-binding universal stress UspA family protein